MLPLVGGFLLAGPISGMLSDRYGASPISTGGVLLAAMTFVMVSILPVDFHYALFAALLLLNGIGFGLLASLNTAAVMNAVPADERDEAHRRTGSPTGGRSAARSATEADESFSAGAQLRASGR